MPGTLNFKKVAKTIKIFAFAQVGLMAMLVYVAMLFQKQFLVDNRSDYFMYSVIASFLIQCLFFYPIYKFSGKEADRDLTLTSSNLNTEEIKVLSKKKRYSDIAKFSVFIFYSMFILQAPGKNAPGSHLVLIILYFSFILTVLTYLQCYNFAAKKLMKQGTVPHA